MIPFIENDIDYLLVYRSFAPFHRYPRQPNGGPILCGVDCCSLALRFRGPCFTFQWPQKLQRRHAVFDSPGNPVVGTYPASLDKLGWDGRAQAVANFENRRILLHNSSLPQSYLNCNNLL